MTAGHGSPILMAIGLNPKFISQLNTADAQQLEHVVHEAGLERGCSESVGKLLVSVASGLKSTPFVDANRPTLLAYIADGRISSQAQVAAAIEYLTSGVEKFDVSRFEQQCGVGVVISPEHISSVVAGALSSCVEEIKVKRYFFAFGPLLGKIRVQLPFCDAAVLKTELDAQILALLGPKTEKDSIRTKKPKVPKEVNEAEPNPMSAPIMTMAEIEKQYIGRALDSAVNTPELTAMHNTVTGGRIRTRFPPEPNGFLHIGHAKAMNFSFGFAKSKGGVTFLRYDDTNPSAEKRVFIDSIAENVSWLGHSPFETTYSSEYFPELYELAMELIRRGKAYVCHQTQAEIKAARAARMDQPPSPWRDTPIEENLRKFEWMRQGRYKEGEVTLRMKIDIAHANPCMWDPVAYRIKYEAHPHVGDAWCIYPSYDFSHCLVDSIEHITHSLCTLEFEVRRDSYYWLLEALDLYRPLVWEYSRLNITYNVMSKRKLKQLVEQLYVNGWDDPRMLTVNGLRRRGYTPTAINEFCARVGVTRSENTIAMSLLEACIRQEQDEQAPRTMAVLDPLRMTLTNVPDDFAEFVDVPIHPKRSEMGTRPVALSKTVFIDRSDFRMDDSPSFYGLAPGKQVHLKFAYHITCQKAVVDEAGNVVELQCTLDKDSTTKLKGIIHWVSGPNPLPVVVRLYSYLFKSMDPSALGDEWLDDLNEKSLVVMDKALVDGSLRGVAQGTRFQFERLGYFIVDSDSVLECPVFNRIVELKESKEKRDM
uniref:glutamine--tRNA ligase n=1 Tax=Spongospora subterranea TaxID=70186 RepID=A0A0H5QKT6_9EUKA|eukprot:CRZ02237.1 hypothetical protein [Spongospora subterranea]